MKKTSTAFVLVALTVFTFGIAVPANKAEAASINPEIADWKDVRACYQESGYQFFSDFSGLESQILSWETPSGVVHYLATQVVAGADLEGRLFPIRLSGEVLDSEEFLEIDIDNSVRAEKIGAVEVDSPVGQVITVGEEDSVLIESFEFGLSPEGDVFVARFTGTDVASGLPAEYQFDTEMPSSCGAVLPPAPDCRKIISNRCIAEGSCTACAFTHRAGRITGCSCTAGGWLPGWCLWFKIKCVRAACATPCTTRKLPGTHFYFCGC